MLMHNINSSIVLGKGDKKKNINRLNTKNSQTNKGAEPFVALPLFITAFIVFTILTVLHPHQPQIEAVNIFFLVKKKFIVYNTA